MHAHHRPTARRTAPTIALALSCGLGLAGCVGLAGMMGASVNAYEGPARPDAEVASIIRTKDAASDGVGMLSKVDDVVYGDDVMKGYPSHVKVLPGAHKVTVKCMQGKRYAFPSFTGNFEAGRRYELACKDMGNGYASAHAVDLGPRPR